MDVSSSKWRWSRLATLMAGIGLVAAACGGGGSSGSSNGSLASNQILRVNINTEPNSLDPGQQQYAYEGAVGASISQALLKVKPDLSDVQGGAAQSWDTSSDGLTWTFHLRSNGKWSDGKPVTGKDFVFAWQRILDPRLAASYADPFFDGTVAGAQDYSNLDPTKDAAKIPDFLNKLGLSAPDDHTFVVKLQAPAPYFKWIASLWMSAPVRKDVVDQYGSDKWATSPKSLITNGQYKVSEMVSKDHITIVPNQYYWGGQPTIKQIVNYEITDDNQAYSKYQTGELDLVNIPLADTDLVKNDAKLKQELKVVPQLTVFWMDFNLRTAPFNNKQARMAFSKAIDRTLLVQNVGKGRWVESPTFIPKGMNGYKPDLGSIQKFDAAGAKTMLKEALGDPSKITVDFLIRNSTANVQLGQFIQDQLQNNLGVKVKLDVIDSKTVTQRLRKHDYNLYVGGWGADYPDDQDWFDIWMTGSGNVFGGYSNPQFDKLVKQADQERDATKRQSLYDQAHKVLVEDAAGGFLYQRNYWFLKKPYVNGVMATPIDQENIGDQFWGNVSIAQH